MTTTNYVEFVARIAQGNPSPGGLPLLRQALLGIEPLGENANVLEIGSNTGASLTAIAQSLPDANVIGIDISESMVTECQTYLSDMRDEGRIGKNVNVQLGDATKLNFPNQSIDLVVSGGTLSFVNNREEAIKEISRVLKPGGTFLSLEYGYDVSNIPEDASKKISSIIEVDVSKLTLDYWYSLHSKSKMMIEGFYVQKPYFHRSKQNTNVTSLVEENLRERGREVIETDMASLEKALDAFAANEPFTNLITIYCRKTEGTKLLSDAMN